MKNIVPTALAITLSTITASAQQFYTSAELADFMANLPGASHTEGFDGVPSGPMGSVYQVHGTNGIDWNLTAGDGVLWGIDGDHASSDTHTEALRFTFTGSEIYAFGGQFFGVDWNDNSVAADITFSTNTGVSETFTAPDTATFLGLISDQPLEWVEIFASGEMIFTATTSATAAIPEPTTTTALFGGLALVLGIWWRRREKAARSMA